MDKKYQKKPVIVINDLGKVPPQSIELEECVLGTFISNYKLIAKYPYLKPEVFYKEVHQKIYKAMLDLYERDEKVDLFT
jgi:replicative DNA helicase